MDNFKKCSKCGEVKLLDCFNRDKSNKDGYKFWCRKCHAGAFNKYRAENHEKIKITKDKYYAKNREKILAKTLEWRTKNPEKVKDSYAKYYAENSEKVKAFEIRYTKELRDSYIKKQIKQQTGVPYEHITQDLIETKRLHILIKRKLKDLTK